MNKNLTEKSAILYMVLCGLCWSTTSLMIKLSPWNNFQVTAGRGVLAGLFFIGYIHFVRHGHIVINRVTAAVAFFTCFKYMSFIAASKLAPGANCAAILQTSAVLVLLANCLIDKKRPSRRDAAVIIAVAFGIFLFFYGEFDASSMAGNMLAFLAAICTAVLYYASGKFKTVEENLSALIMGSFMSAAISLFITFGEPAEISLKSVGVLLFLGFVQQGLAYVLYTNAVRVLSSFACSVLAAIEPVLSPVFCFIFIGEMPTRFAAVGTIVVIGSITLWSISSFALPETKKQKSDF
ncbi:MAG: EamA family transporter [Firmicutes bacterium]|nr:EamA family transporter [Bacillota bacterium]